MKTLKIKQYDPTDISIFKNADGTYGITAILTAKSDTDAQLFQQRIRVDLDASDTANLDALLTKLLTKATDEGMI